MTAELEVLQTPEQLTPEWLAAALDSGPIESLQLTRIGTGQMSESTRVSIDYAAETTGPASVVLKTASTDESSRATGVGLGIYEREVRFYRELAPRIGGPLADCRFAAIAPDGSFTLVLEDLAPARQGDQIAGCTLEQARVAMRSLAQLHAPVFADPQLGAIPWLNQGTVLTQALVAQLLDGFVERHGERVADEHLEVCRRFVASLDGWSQELRPPLGLVHGDYRLDNMLFGEAHAPRPFAVVDWQTVGWGQVMTDASYFLGGSLTLEDRRAHEQELLREYHEALHEHGVRGFGWEECWEGYRRQAFLGVLMTVAPAMLVQRTERGDEMFLVTLARYAQQVLDLDAIELLPEPGSGRPPALRPEPQDEAPHTPGSEELWNESWYFDAVSADERLGVYTRLGLYPNLGVSWMTTFVCGPDMPTIALVEFAAPPPRGGQLSLSSEHLRAEHICIEPLESFEVRVQGAAESFADPSALLRGERGAPAELAVALRWDTTGEPYAYRATTRYEIPCRVSGTVSWGEETIELSGVGQRDHSWGVRDWWSAEWMWSAAHLQDGTHLHGVEFRLPGAPPVGIGYREPPEGGVEELDVVRAREDATPDGLIERAWIAFGELEVDVQPLAFGPLRLTAPDGRVSQFPRAMCSVRTRDGRSGVAWVEWNRNASL
ncbi:MAG TPA: phosphotransferase [Solirubrobacteraceae bacterium]|nr:phosphotransferase [Solirubrobacteraceae bacterium]